MPAPYDTTLLANNTNIVTTVSAVNTMSGGLFGAAVLVMFYAIMFITTEQGYTQPKILLGISFVMSLISLSMFLMGWLAGYYTTINLIVLVIALIMTIWGGSNS